jgi:hypothetical protein
MLSGAAVTNKFGLARAKASLLNNRRQLTNLIGLVGSAGENKLNPDPRMGCDPELFLSDADGKLIPAFDVLPSKKDNSVFWDGFQAEFTVFADSCLINLATRIQNQMHLLKRTCLKPVNLMAGDVVEVDKALLKKLPDERVALGCDPSINLYGSQGQIPVDPRALALRFAGGHIHFGDDSLARDQVYASQVVYNLDRILGIWAVGAAANYDKTKSRRKHYGLAGEFRLPSHGLEYRTLSNFWLAGPQIYYPTFELARVIMRATSYGILDFWVADTRVVVDTINNYDVEMARRILRYNEKLFIKLFAASNLMYAQKTKNVPGNPVPVFIEPEFFAKRALQVGLEGMECVVPKASMETNWRLDTVTSLVRTYPDCWSTTCLKA